MEELKSKRQCFEKSRDALVQSADQLSEEAEQMRQAAAMALIAKSNAMHCAAKEKAIQIADVSKELLAKEKVLTCS